MDKVPVIPVDDNDIIDLEDGCFDKPWNKHGTEFVLDHREYLRDSHEVPARKQLENFETWFRTLAGPAVVVLDLGLKENELTEEQKTKLNGWFSRELLRAFQLDERVDVGLFLLLTLLENARWYGVIQIASDQQTNDILRLLKERTGILLSSRKPISPTGGPVFIDWGWQGGLKSKGIARKAFNQAIECFLQQFNLLWWFANPPRLPKHSAPPGMTVEWFDNAGYHSPSDEGGLLHLEAVGSRFPLWKNERYAKALMRSEGCATKIVVPENAGYDASWVCLQDFFGETMVAEGLGEEDVITFPTMPAFPFLLAVRNFLAFYGGGTLPAVLLRAERNAGVNHVIHIGTRTTQHVWPLAFALWEGVWERKVGDMTNYFLNAVHAMPIANLTELPEGPLQAVLTGVRGAAVPWYTQEYVGLSWRTMIKRR